MILNGLIGRRGHLKSINEYWVVGRFIIVSKLAQDSSRAVLAAEQMYKLHPPPWYLRSIFKDLDLLNNKMDNEENTKVFNDEVYYFVLNSCTLYAIRTLGRLPQMQSLCLFSLLWIRSFANKVIVFLLPNFLSNIDLWEYEFGNIFVSFFVVVAFQRL